MGKKSKLFTLFVSTVMLGGLIVWFYWKFFKKNVEELTED